MKVSKRSVRSNRLRTPKFADSGQKRARRGEPRRAREQRAHIGKKVAELSIEGSARSLLELRKQMPVNKDTGEIDYYRFLQSPVCSYIYAGIPAVRTKKEMPCKFGLQGVFFITVYLLCFPAYLLRVSKTTAAPTRDTTIRVTKRMIMPSPVFGTVSSSSGSAGLTSAFHCAVKVWSPSTV